MGTLSIFHPRRRRCVPLRSVLFILLALLAPSLQLPAQAIPATDVPLVMPSAISFDRAGNLYIADTASHLIRKVDTAGLITTIAGTGTQGFSGDNGPATAAQLDSPQGLALDTANNLYLADTHNHRIRRIDGATGLITTIAGTGTPGFSGDSGPAASARLNLPAALALDAQNDLYLADTGNHRIRRIDASTGAITTFAGTGTQGFSGDTGPATAATIDSPTGLALDAASNLYLADTHNHRIRRIAASTGIITTIIGTGNLAFSGDTGPAKSASLALPRGLTVDAAGNLYLADTANQRIRRIDASTGIVTTIAGTGTQGFSGDTGLATVASLDTPLATAVSSTNLLTLADAANQRIRELNAQSSAATIQTIAGLTAAGALALQAPSSIVYGAGSITANIATGTSATGLVTFLDTFNSITTAVATLPLTANAAILDTSSLAAGLHSITAHYAGDQTHPPTQSPAFVLNILPRPLTATISPFTVIYGQPVPALTGNLTGILPQDAATVSASFTTQASTLSPVGSYPILATIGGPAAGNYSLATPDASVTITPAATLITLTDLLTTSASIAQGVPITLTSHVASSTTGSPTGTITLLDGAAPLLTSPISASGDTTFTAGSLFEGSHTLTARYSGDANFIPSTSAPNVVIIGTTPPPSIGDFTLTSTGATTQTIASGSSASFTFSVQLQGNITSPIALAATGLPNLATASFSPAFLPPGSATNTFTLTVSTPKTTATRKHLPSSIQWAFLLFPIAGLALRPRTRLTRRGLLAFAVLSLILPIGSGCANRTSAVGSLTNSPTGYTITVTGTATGAGSSLLQHSASVTLNLQAPS